MAGRASFTENGEVQGGLPQTPGSPSPRPAGAPTERARYNSPPYASSITPPPTTQVLPRPYSPSPFRAEQMEQPQPVRTPTPSRSLLSSPPPTVERSVMPASEHTSGLPFDAPSPAQVAKATAAELQSYVEAMRRAMAKLTSGLSEARTEAAHYKLQYNLLSIESEEAAKRMAVEQEMTRREVEVLRHTEPGLRPSPPLDELISSPPQFHEVLDPSRALFELEEHARRLQSENDRLGRRLRRAKKLILYRDGEIYTLLQERDRLRQRIKENREHFNQFRRTHGLYEGATPQPSDSLVATPQHHPPKSVGPPNTAPVSNSRAGGGQDTFAALLLAGQVLGRENASPESPPTRPRAPRSGLSGHSRGTQSLSSLPSTPSLLRPPPSNEPKSVSRGHTRNTADDHTPRKPIRAPERERRRESRDSTISAPDIDPDSPTHPRRVSKRADVVKESEASQLATHMLRRSPVLAKDHGGSPTDKARRSSQMKLLGKIKKPGVSASSDDAHLKRARVEGSDQEGPALEGRSSKRVRTSEGIGLGIGAWRSPNA